MKKFPLIILTLILLATPLTWAQSADMHPETAAWGSLHSKAHVAPELRPIESSDETLIDVIVQFNAAPTAAHHQKVADLGGSLKRELGVIKGAVYHMPAVAALTADPEVVYISPDRALRGSLDDIAAGVTSDNVIYNWGITGAGIGIAVIDSGISAHADLHPGTNGTVVYSQDFTGGGNTNDQ